jgi:hypothetical protein
VDASGSVRLMHLSLIATRLADVPASAAGARALLVDLPPLGSPRESFASESRKSLRSQQSQGPCESAVELGARREGAVERSEKMTVSGLKALRNLL